MNEDVPCLLDVKDLIPFPPSNNFNYNIPNNLITVTNWEEVLKTNHLIFNLKYTGSYIILKAKISGESDVYDYGEWKRKFGENNFIVSELIIGDETKYDPFIQEDGKIDVLINQRAEIRIPELSGYIISRVLAKYENGDPDAPEIYYPEQINTTNSIVIPEVNFSNNSLKINSGGNAVFKFISEDYPNSNLEKVIIEDSQGNSLTINKFTANGSIQSFGTSQVSLRAANINTPEEGEYTLKLMNIYYNTTIKLIKR